jgi:hypothetical protein
VGLDVVETEDLEAIVPLVGDRHQTQRFGYRDAIGRVEYVLGVEPGAEDGDAETEEAQPSD